MKTRVATQQTAILERINRSPEDRGRRRRRRLKKKRKKITRS